MQPDFDEAVVRQPSLAQVLWRRLELEFSAKRFDDPQLDLQRADKVFQAIDKQAATVNEWRATMKLPPVPGGDVMKEPPPPPMMPGAVGQISQAGDLPADTGDDCRTGRRSAASASQIIGRPDGK